MMATLADHVSTVGRFARSANLERDVTRPEPLDGYVVTARALDVIERITTTAVHGDAGGAWSLTGPYGSGKSSLALLLDAALGDATQTRQLAWRLIDDASTAIAELLRETHRRHGTEERGFHRGLVTANREPLSHTVLRALHAAVIRRHGRIPPVSRFREANLLRAALDDAATDDPRRTGPSPTALVEIARCLARDAPLLLIIDEFGKNLEAIRDGSSADPYLLQQLAEAGQGSGLPIFVLTLQHLSFEDYLAGTEGPQRREWAKVQGRFEDVAYVESAAQTRALIGTVFDVDDDLKARIDRWAGPLAEAMRPLGVADLAMRDVVASCYPLHPLTAVALPELCSRYGQHERTLFSFLTGPDRASAASFLAATDLPQRGSLPTVGLDAVYDYFVANGALTATSAGESGRWTEIAIRLRDTHGLSTDQARLAKIIALLNLISTTGTVRASRTVLTLADPNADIVLSGMEEAGIVTYRDFADEYRIWQGTDIDIRRLLDAAHQRVRRQPLVDLLTAIDQPQPAVAARHSAEHNLLRVFMQRYADGASDAMGALDAFSPYDGEVRLVVGSPGTIPTGALSQPTAKPIVAAVPDDVTALDAAAREVAAVTEVLGDPAVADDWVARRELGERLAQARVALEHGTASTFGADTCRWFLLGAHEPIEIPTSRGSAVLSVAADHAYPSTPTVRNEMLNRTDLTSQGAKARRILLEAMIERGTEPSLGFEGYGPEVAMYQAFLAETGLHGPDVRNHIMVFRAPSDPTLHPAWELLEAQLKRAKSRRINLNDICAALLSPPIGMKAAVIPVFITAALLDHSDDIAIYEHGTFKPLLTPDLSERMVRNPAHFDLKHFANTTGARRQVVDALAERLAISPKFRRHRVANVLAVVGHLVSHIRRLDNYTRRTNSLTQATLRAREVLAAAVEPDELLFDALPTALGFRPVPADTKTYGKALLFADAVTEALDDLTGRHRRLTDELIEELLAASAETSRLAVTGQAAALDSEVLDPNVRAFVLTLANDTVDTDADWIRAVATVVSKKAPHEWTDEDRKRFGYELPQQIAAFQRLVALHADHRATGGGPFSPRRVTITRPDGRERPLLVAVDREQRDDLDEALNDALHQMTAITGSDIRAQHALLALLSERLLPDDQSERGEPVIDLTDERAIHD